MRIALANAVVTVLVLAAAVIPERGGIRLKIDVTFDRFSNALAERGVVVRYRAAARDRLRGDGSGRCAGV